MNDITENQGKARQRATTSEKWIPLYEYIHAKVHTMFVQTHKLNSHRHMYTKISM